MIKITLTSPSSGRFGGFEFADGVAVTGDLSRHQRGYFTAIGANITETADAIETIPGTEDEEPIALTGVPLEDLTPAELRTAARNLGIEIPARAKKADLIALINEHPDVPVLSDEAGTQGQEDAEA